MMRVRTSIMQHTVSKRKKTTMQLSASFAHPNAPRQALCSHSGLHNAHIMNASNELITIN